MKVVRTLGEEQEIYDRRLRERDVVGICDNPRRCFEKSSWVACGYCSMVRENSRVRLFLN